MKICLINNLYEPYNRGGAETVVKTAAEELQNQGHEVFLITTKPYFCKKPTIDGYKVYYLNSLYHSEHLIPRPLRVFYHLANIFSFVKPKKIANIIAREQPDNVIGHNLLGIGYRVPGLMDRLSVNYTQVLHDIQLLHPGGLMLFGRENILLSLHAKIYQALTRQATKSITRVVSPSQWLLDLYKNQGFFKNANSRVIFNPMKMNFQSGEVTKKSTGFNFISVGRVSEDKGSYILVEAFKALCKNNREMDLKLTFIGAIENKKKMEKIISDAFNIKTMGWQNNKIVREAITRADCLVAASLCYENSPTVIYEASVLGASVIASRIGGITELVESIGGELFNPGDKSDLLNKMEEVIKKTPVNKNAGDKRDSVVIFSPEKYVKELLSFK